MANELISTQKELISTQKELISTQKELISTQVELTKSPIPLSNLTNPNRGGFIQADVEAMNQALPKSNFPWLFDNENIQWLDRKIVNVKDINDGSALERYTAQAPRTGANPQYSAINSDIRENGYSLTELPPAVRVVKDDTENDTLISLDGRTRLEILEVAGVETVIVDVFVMNNAHAIRTAQVYNRYHKPFGEGSTTDIEQCILELDNEGEMEKLLGFKLKNLCVKDPAELKIRMDKAGKVIKKEANALSNNKLADDQLAQIYANVLNKFATDKTVLIRKFNNGGRVKEVLQDSFNLWTTATNEVFPFSGSELAVGKLLEAIWKRREWLGENPRHTMDIVLYCGKPNPLDPEGSWKKATVGAFKKEWDKIESYFDYGNKNQVRLLGAIPQIRSLSIKQDGAGAECYPMDKIHYFK